MHIAIVGSRGFPYVYSGYETFVSEIAPRLVSRGHRVTVYCHRGLFAQRPGQVQGISLVYVPGLHHKVLSQFSHSLLATIHLVTRDVDVALFVNSANGPFGAITRLTGKRTAINVDGMEWLRPKWKGAGARYFYAASKLSTRWFDAVITDSTRMAEVYMKEFGSPSEVIEYGGNPAFSITPDLLSRFGIASGEYYLIVGRLVPDNNAHLIVQAFCRTTISKKLVIVGDVPYADEYAQRIRSIKDDRLVFTGYVRDSDVLRELYCNAYAYFHGHEFGGTNPALLTALSCGCFIEALDTPFSREVLDDGTYGVFFPKDASAASAVMSSWDERTVEASSYKAIARHRIAERYTWDRITRLYEGLFMRICPPK